jgi:hypothetical protein
MRSTSMLIFVAQVPENADAAGVDARVTAHLRLRHSIG